jgi:hypothetical protein
MATTMRDPTSNLLDDVQNLSSLFFLHPSDNPDSVVAQPMLQ